MSTNNRFTGFANSGRPQASGLSVSGGPGKFQQNAKLRAKAAASVNSAVPVTPAPVQANSQIPSQQKPNQELFFQSKSNPHPSSNVQNTLVVQNPPAPEIVSSRQAPSFSANGINRLQKKIIPTTSNSQNDRNNNGNILTQDFPVLVGAAGLDGSQAEYHKQQVRHERAATPASSIKTEPPAFATPATTTSTSSTPSATTTQAARPKFQSLADKSLLESKLDIVIKHVQRIIVSQDESGKEQSTLKRNLEQLHQQVDYLQQNLKNSANVAPNTLEEIGNQVKNFQSEIRQIQSDMKHLSTLNHELVELKSKIQNFDKFSQSDNAGGQKDERIHVALQQTSALKDESRAQLNDIKMLYQQSQASNSKINKLQDLVSSLEQKRLEHKHSNNTLMVRATCFHDHVPIYETLTDLQTVCRQQSLGSDSKAVLARISALDTVAVHTPLIPMTVTNANATDNANSIAQESYSIAFVEWFDTQLGNVVSGYTLVYGPRLAGVGFLTNDSSDSTESTKLNCVPYLGDFTM